MEEDAKEHHNIMRHHHGDAAAGLAREIQIRQSEPGSHQR